VGNVFMLLTQRENEIRQENNKERNLLFVNALLATKSERAD
jgi:hypothetical protein